MLDGENLAKLIARRFEILETLYHKKEMKLSDLTQQLSRDFGNMSRYVKELERADLIEVRRQEKEKRGRPYTVCVLSNDAKQIMRLYIKQPKKEIPTWMPRKFLTILSSEDKSEKLKEFAAGKLTDIAVQNALLIFSIKEYRELFKKLVIDPSPEKDKVAQYLRSCLSISIPQIIKSNDREIEQWFDEIYVELLAITEEKKSPLRSWAATLISKVARLTKDPQRLSDAIQKLFELYFKNGKDLMDTVKYELTKFQESQDKVIEKILAEMEKPKRRTKAETLFEELISLWFASK